MRSLGLFTLERKRLRGDSMEVHIFLKGDSSIDLSGDQQKDLRKELHQGSSNWDIFLELFVFE